MAKELGFHHGAPENKDLTFERVIHGRKYIFTKTREKGDIFLYGCALGNSKRAFFSQRDLNQEEIECLSQFDDFIGRGPAIQTATGRKAR